MFGVKPCGRADQNGIHIFGFHDLFDRRHFRAIGCSQAFRGGWHRIRDVSQPGFWIVCNGGRVHFANAASADDAKSDHVVFSLQ